MARIDDWDPPLWVRIPALEDALQCTPSEITWATLQGLAEAGRAENLVLEYKEWFYGPKAGTEVAKDVAALANAAGGLIIIGIKEDDLSRASTLNSLPFDEKQHVTMTDRILSSTVPIVQSVSIGTITNPDQPGHGAYLILVPPSTAAPHGVRTAPDTYMWPVRHDRQTRWMTEPEIASRYRDRFANATAQIDRLSTVAAEGDTRLDRTHKAWLSVSCVPESPARTTHTKDDDRSWFDNHFMSRPWGFSSNIATGRRRNILSNEAPFRGTSSDHHIELHRDGSAYAAIGLRHPVIENGTPKRPLTSDLAIEAGETTAMLFRLLDTVTRYASTRGTSGDLLVRARLFPGLSDPWTALQAGIEQVPHALVAAEFHLPGTATVRYRRTDADILPVRQIHGTRPLKALTPVDVTLPLTVAINRHDLAAVTAELIYELFAEFGHPPADPPLLNDGSINSTSPSRHAVEPLEGWLQQETPPAPLSQPKQQTPASGMDTETSEHRSSSDG